MKKIWVLLVIVLVILLLFMTYYILLIEESDTEKRFVAFFRSETSESHYYGHTNNSEYSEIIYNFNESNIVEISFYLSWWDDNTYGGFPPEESYEYYDMFQMNVTGPNGQFHSYRSKNSPININFLIHERPQFSFIKVNSTKEAYERFSNHTGVGNWTINISIEASGSIMGESDNGNDWELIIFTDYYTIDVEEI